LIKLVPGPGFEPGAYGL